MCVPVERWRSRTLTSVFYVFHVEAFHLRGLEARDRDLVVLSTEV